jgi:hypothetical protein
MISFTYRVKAGHPKVARTIIFGGIACFAGGVNLTARSLCVPAPLAVS